MWKRNDFTERLIREHIEPGMHVLDVGCGNGEISLMIAAAVGANGSVHGIDTNPDAISTASSSAAAQGLHNCTFSVGDINCAPGEKFDVIFGRRILMYVPDPARTVQSLKAALKSGGIMLFQESDESGTILNGEEMPLHVQVQNWIWETVRREGGHTHIGSEMYGLMKAAGLSVRDYQTDVTLQTAETGTDLSWVVQMMIPRMKALGVPADCRQLEERLRKESQSASAGFVRDLAFGICACKEKN
jgi:ubiquinone/menaquinone biosynthesis C-methylase UbiE